MRTTGDLIRELDQEAEKFSEVWLAVGFEMTTTFIHSTDDHRLQHLNDAVGAGGKPIGLIGLFMVCDEEGFVSDLSVYSRLLPEYAEEDWAHEYLAKIMSAQRAAFVKTGAREVSVKPGWLN